MIARKGGSASELRSCHFVLLRTIVEQLKARTRARGDLERNGHLVVTTGYGCGTPLWRSGLRECAGASRVLRGGGDGAAPIAGERGGSGQDDVVKAELVL